jgi:hypothetical protein
MKEKPGHSSEVDKRKEEDGNEMKRNQFHFLSLLSPAHFRMTELSTDFSF